MEALEMIVCSFITSVGLGIVFRIEKHSLLWAGLGGGLTRMMYLFLIKLTNTTFITYFLAAVCAALYAELLAMHKKMPSTVFLYPTILPLVPGGTLYYIAAYVMMGDFSSAFSSLWECTLSLGGMCLGFVIISTFTYYRRIYALGATLEKYLKKWIRMLAGKPQ